MEEKTIQELLFLRFRTCRVTPQLSKTSLSPPRETTAKWTYLKQTVSTILGNASLQKDKNLSVNSPGQISLQSTKKHAAGGCWITEIFGEHWKGSYYADQIHKKNEHLRDQCPQSFTWFCMLKAPHYLSQWQMRGAHREELNETFAISHHKITARKTESAILVPL